MYIMYIYIYIAVYLYDKQPPLGRSIAGSICKDGTNIIKEKTNCVNECFNSLYIYICIRGSLWFGFPIQPIQLPHPIFLYFIYHGNYAIKL